MPPRGAKGQPSLARWDAVPLLERCWEGKAGAPTVGVVGVAWQSTQQTLGGRTEGCAEDVQGGLTKAAPARSRCPQRLGSCMMLASGSEPVEAGERRGRVGRRGTSGAGGRPQRVAVTDRPKTVGSTYAAAPLLGLVPGSAAVS